MKEIKRKEYLIKEKENEKAYLIKKKNRCLRKNKKEREKVIS